MTIFEIFAALITLAAVFSYLNFRFLKLPTTIGLMVMALVSSLILIWTGRFSPTVFEAAQDLLNSIDFSQTLMHGMLGFLLFAGALHVNLNDLREQKWVIALLATVGTVLSTALAGGLAWLILNRVLDFGVPFIYCLLLGAIVSPTDPIAVMGILKTLGVPKSLETKITGESLFNDGVGVVIFLAIAGVIGFGHAAQPGPAGALVEPITPIAAAVATATDEVNRAGQVGDEPGTDHESAPEKTNERAEVSAADIAKLFGFEAVGGALIGLLLGLLAFYLLYTIDNYHLEVLISLALVAGGYALANRLHLSGPIAMVVAALIIGNHGREMAMSDLTRNNLDTFWELIDEILNAVLFLLIGLEILVLRFNREFLVAGLLMIPALLVVRFVSVGIPIAVRRRFRSFTPHAVKILTWGGLRGGISVALALSIPKTLHGEAVPYREVILAVTYSVVIFSIIAQGLTLGPFVRRCLYSSTAGSTAGSTAEP
ncbi:MAG: sodium:proton antiporter [Acidobacteria bacterium]|nr:sodium:proton antiporter [Acidobacteriota bacterium]